MHQLRWLVGDMLPGNRQGHMETETEAPSGIVLPLVSIAHKVFFSTVLTTRD